MGVYIKGMEMPKDGCHHTICIYADGTVSTGGRAYMAVPVPPHGRLIDADALEKEHMKRAYENFRSYQFHVSATAWINEAPTIIPEEPPKEGALSGK